LVRRFKKIVEAQKYLCIEILRQINFQYNNFIYSLYAPNYILPFEIVIIINSPINIRTMESKKPLLFVFWVIAIILGITLYKQFDFENLKFEKPALAIVYFVVFVFSVYYLVKNSKKQSEK
jgi:hypothetical protein